MAAVDFAKDGTCLADFHNRDYNEFIDTLEARIAALEGGGAGGGVLTIPPDNYSTLGTVTGGTSVAAGSFSPAAGGEVVISTTASTWIRITGTAAQVGDAVFHTFQGARTTFPTNPANRRVSGAATGAPGTVLAAGVIELALSSTNPDGVKSHWFIMRKGT